MGICYRLSESVGLLAWFKLKLLVSKLKVTGFFSTCFAGMPFDRTWNSHGDGGRKTHPPHTEQTMHSGKQTTTTWCYCTDKWSCHPRVIPLGLKSSHQLTRLQICPLNIFGNYPPQMVPKWIYILVKPGVWRLYSGPNLQPWDLRQVDFPNLRIAIAEYDQPHGWLFGASCELWDVWG